MAAKAKSTNKSPKAKTAAAKRAPKVQAASKIEAAAVAKVAAVNSKEKLTEGAEARVLSILETYGVQMRANITTRMPNFTREARETAISKLEKKGKIVCTIKRTGFRGRPGTTIALAA